MDPTCNEFISKIQGYLISPIIYQGQVVGIVGSVGRGSADEPGAFGPEIHTRRIDDQRRRGDARRAGQHENAATPRPDRQVDAQPGRRLARPRPGRIDCRVAGESRPIPDEPVGLYPWSKALSERLVTEADSPQLRTVVLRPRLIWGPGDTTLTPRLVEAMRSGQFAWIAGGTVLTSTGRLHLRNAAFAMDEGPLDPACPCPVCRRWSRGYLRHLLNVGEPSGARLVTLHNLAWLLAFVDEIRLAVTEGTLDRLRSATASTWS